MILDDIAPSISDGSIPEIIKLAATLRFLAVGTFQGVIATNVYVNHFFKNNVECHERNGR